MGIRTAIAVGLELVSTTLVNIAYVRERGAVAALPALSLRRPLQSLRLLLTDRTWLGGLRPGKHRLRALCGGVGPRLAGCGSECRCRANGRAGLRIAERRGMTLVPPFDDPLVIAGQGTAALELVDQAGGLDLLLAPVGGGGLIAGCAVGVKALCLDARVIGVEPEAADDYRRSLAADRRISIEVPRTIADALQVTRPGKLTFAINRRELDGIVTVSDAELVDAMRCGSRSSA